MNQEKDQLVQLARIEQQNSQLVSLQGNSLSQQRQIAKKQFYANKKSMLQKVQTSKNVTQVMQNVVNSMADSYDDLSGSQQMMLDNGQMTSALLVQMKKVQTASALADVIKKKNDIEKQNKSIDVTSPQVELLIRVILQKIFEVIQQNVSQSDLQALLITKIPQSLKDWDKQFKNRLNGLNGISNK